MRFVGPFYEGDGIIHSRLASKRAAGAAARLANTTEARAPWIVALVERFFTWLERSARDARQREIEKYLARSTDIFDLERRMRLLEHHDAPFG